MLHPLLLITGLQKFSNRLLHGHGVGLRLPPASSAHKPALLQHQPQQYRFGYSRTKYGAAPTALAGSLAKLVPHLHSPLPCFGPDAPDNSAALGYERQQQQQQQ